MQTARVIGHATSTVKHASLNGFRMVLIQPLDIRNQPDEQPVIALDQLGAGRGDLVFFTSDSKYIQQMTGRKDSPIRYSIQGILDYGHD